MKIEFNMSDLVKALDVVSVVSPRPVTASGGAGFLFVTKGETCHVYSRDTACVAMSTFPLISSSEDGQFVYPAEYINALRVLAPTSDTCQIETGEENEKFFVRYSSSSGAKAERGSFDPRLLVTCDQDLSESAKDGSEFFSGLLREAILEARPFLAKEHQEECMKGLQVFDATKEEYKRGDGCLYVSDGFRTFYFQCGHLAGKSLEIHGQHLPQLLNFLGKSETTTIRKGQHFTFAVTDKGDVFGWPKLVKLHAKFGYYPLKSDAFILRTPKVRLTNALAHAKSELDSKEDKITVSFDPEAKTLRFEFTSGTVKVQGIPVIVDLVQAEPTPWSFGVNINHFIEMISPMKGNEIELRVRIVSIEGKQVAMFRTIDTFLLEQTGKVTTEPEGAQECLVTRFMASKA